MVVTFKSSATGSLYMNKSFAKILFGAIGHEASDQGVITVEKLPDAIAALNGLVDPDSNHEKKFSPAEIASLAEHIAPAIDMFEQASAAGKPVTWGV